MGSGLAGALADLAGNSRFLLLAMTAIAIFIMGMGMTALACYLLAVAMLVPALIPPACFPSPRTCSCSTTERCPSSPA